MQNHKIEEALRIVRKAELASQSVAWWEDNVIRLMDELDAAQESDSIEEQLKIPKLTSQLKSFLKRSKLEMDNICKIETEISQFIKNEKETKKAQKTTKKKPRKKSL